MDVKRQLVIRESENLVSAKSVVYVMSRDMRVNDNHALLFAQKIALEQKLPLIVVFCLYEKAGFRSREHFKFMIEGLVKLEKDLAKLDIGFVLTIGKAELEIQKVLQKLEPLEVFFDFSPLRHARKLIKTVAQQISSKVSVVDTHNIIPLWFLSDKEEFAAHTIRSKVHKNLENWLVDTPKIVKHPYLIDFVDFINDWKLAKEVIKNIPNNGSEIKLKAGEQAAQNTLNKFISERLTKYGDNRNVPTLDGQSNLSAYLHFGHISSLRIALSVIEAMKEPPLLLRMPKLASYEGEATHEDSANAFLEELIVRKELADNFCFYNENYDNLNGAKPWANESLNLHSSDKRDFIYNLDEWENALTHDSAWNASQQQLRKTGKIHGYMRMYWAKKILEWSDSPENAIKTAIYLNDKYSIDGGDPNGYTGIMWSIAGIHDRPWFERPVYGKIRYMNRGGLERRFDVVAYENTWLK